jgi:hypothetical protein
MSEYRLRPHERQALERMGHQAISFAPPSVDPGHLAGCSGIARLGLCIRCDRLPQPGPQIRAQAKRNALGVYECSKQVVGGVHVTSIPPESGIAQTANVGGAVVAIPSTKG